MAFNVNIANSCKVITIRGKRYDATSTQADITFTDIDSNSSITVVMNYDANTGRGNIHVPTSNLPSDFGVYMVCLEEHSVQYACKPLLIKCDIECCLVKLTNELIDCSCDCPRCASALAKAQKIFLLLESAVSAVDLASTNVSNKGYYEDILAKYKKAKEICDNSCGCDC